MTNCSWIVFGPGRTGSYLIMHTLRCYYNSLNLNYQTFDPDFEPHAVSDKKQIWHSHNYKILANIPQYTNLILSTRNIVESAISWCIVQKTKLYHIFPEPNLSLEQLQLLENYNKMEKFVLEIDQLEDKCEQIFNFYKELNQFKEQIKSVRLFLVDYKQISNNFFWWQYLCQLSITLGLSFELDYNLYKDHMPIPNKPWTQIFSNATEIQQNLPNLNKKYQLEDAMSWL